MTASQTLPISIPNRVPLHEHGWVTESSHHTSAGVVVYVHCAACGTRRVDLHDGTGLPPVPQSTEVAGRSSRRCDRPVVSGG